MITKAQARRNGVLVLVVVITLVVLGGAWAFDQRGDDGESGSRTEAKGAPDQSTTTTTRPYKGFSDPTLSGSPWLGTKTKGLLTFRGNPTRSWYGVGPVPRHPAELGSYPPGGGGMCMESHNLGETKVWCGMGWTGQPAVFERKGRTWVVFGAYDGAVHFMDGKTGERILPDFPTGDLIKGSVTVDPDGYPLVYTGSRDNFYRVLSIEGDRAVELYKLSAEAVSPTKWNDDWDSSGMIIDDYLFEGGENSQFHILKLNRSYDAAGHVHVNPQLIWHVPSWDDQLLADLPDDDVSVENSPLIVGDTVYFTNSGGLVQGWDIKGLGSGTAPTRTFRWWMGDDTDATLVSDDKGMIYASAEYERDLPRAQEIGQLVKLDPSKPDDPVVWKLNEGDHAGGGIWATPALHKDALYTATNGGMLMGLDRDTGKVLWSKQFPGGPAWGSPVVVDDVLLEGDCSGVLHAYDVSDTRVDPPQLWQLNLGGCIEATPAVWKGRIYLATRAGRLHILGDGA